MRYFLVTNRNHEHFLVQGTSLSNALEVYQDLYNNGKSEHEQYMYWRAAVRVEESDIKPLLEKEESSG